MASNELVFLLQITCVASGSIFMLRLGSAALTSYIALLGVLSNLLVCQEISLFGLTVTASDSLAVGLILSLNLMQEWFGRAAVRRAIYINFSALLAYLALTQIHLLYSPAPSSASTHIAYQTLLNTMPRLALASLSSYFLVQVADAQVYRALKLQLSSNWFTARSILSLLASELLDTVLFSMLGLYGVVADIGNILFFSYAVKLVTIACFIPFIMLVKKIVPHENQDL